MTRQTRQSIDKDIEQLDLKIQTLRRREADFQRILDNIEELKAEVTAERIGLEAKRNHLEAQKEPINWLPMELLIQIFLGLLDFDSEDPRYRPPFIVSHVCTKWRAIALSTPRLWSRITLRGFKQPVIAQTYITRSAKVPLDIDYASLLDSRPTGECCQVVDFLAKAKPQFYRTEEFLFSSKSTLPIVYLLPVINDFANTFPRLQHLTLSVSTANPSFVESPSLLGREDVIMRSRTTSTDIKTTRSRLLRLTLEQVPLFNFPTAFISNLRVLHLSYSPRRLNSTQHEYHFKMSTLCRFLTLTSLLEELILNNTVPYFDVALPPTDGGGPDSSDTNHLMRMHAVKLEHLKSIDWTYPYTGDVPRFLAMLDTPGLEKLDLWVEDPPTKRTDLLHVRGYLSTSSAHKYIRGIATFSCLRDLSLQCAGEDTTACVLRKFSLPALEKVAFTNVDTAAREAAGGSESSLPVFPRLESIFRDPRLHNLTHLTLSHFKISLEPGRAESVLGYMPVLTSLSLDSCIGVGRLVEGLQERLGMVEATPDHAVGRAAVEGRTRRGVKLCPRLEALSFWGCQDVEFDGLRAIVLARNGSNTDNCEHEVSPKDAAAPNGGKPPTVTRDGEGASPEAVRRDGDGPKIETDARLGRKIKPLRKSRHHVSGGQRPSSPPLTPTTNIVSTLIAMREAFEPANIIYLRVANCKLVNQEQAASLRDLGVVDVIWAGSD